MILFSILVYDNSNNNSFKTVCIDQMHQQIKQNWIQYLKMLCLYVLTRSVHFLTLIKQWIILPLICESLKFSYPRILLVTSPY